MKKEISKLEAKEKIEEFFKEIKSKTPREIRKIKRVAMSMKISLKEKKKLFCPGCFNIYSGQEKIRIKNGIKSVRCSCGLVVRWKIK